MAGIGEIPMEAWMSVGERETQKIIKGLNKHYDTVIQERNLRKDNANIREGYLCFGFIIFLRNYKVCREI